MKVKTFIILSLFGIMILNPSCKIRIKFPNSSENIYKPSFEKKDFISSIVKLIKNNQISDEYFIRDLKNKNIYIYFVFTSDGYVLEPTQNFCLDYFKGNLADFVQKKQILSNIDFDLITYEDPSSGITFFLVFYKKIS